MISSGSGSLYRPCVGVMLFHPSGRVWVGRRAFGTGASEDFLDYWQMPQGGIDEGEDPRAAALRELYEETSIRSVRILAEASQWYSYDLPESLSGKVWKGRYRGQRQKWFALEFLGEDSEVDLLAPEGHSPEFRDWKWSSFHDLTAQAVPFKQEVYAQVCGAFSDIARSFSA